MPAGLLALLLAAAPAACIQLQAGGHGGVARGLSDERCSAPLQSDACYEMVYRAMRHDIARHPELYPRLASSRFSLGDMRALGRGWPSRRGWEELADSCEPCGAPEQERAPIGAAMRLHKAGCHTAVAGEACHREVTWAMQHGIVERPRWYQRLSSNSSFEEFQAFVHDVDTFYRLCPAPCAAHDGAPAQRRPECHTAVEGEECHRRVRWAMQRGFLEHPRWYGNLTNESTFEEFQAHLHGQGNLSRVCPRPCAEPEPRTREGRCRTTVEGEDCHRQVRWARERGIREHPRWYPGLTANSSLEDIQAFLHGSSYQLSLVCPAPCVAQAAPARREQQRPAGPAELAGGAPPGDGCRSAVAGDPCHQEVKWMMNQPPEKFPGLAEEPGLEDVQDYLHGLYPILQLCPTRSCRAAGAAPATARAAGTAGPPAWKDAGAAAGAEAAGAEPQARPVAAGPAAGAAAAAATAGGPPAAELAAGPVPAAAAEAPAAEPASSELAAGGEGGPPGGATEASPAVAGSASGAGATASPGSPSWPAPGAMPPPPGSLSGPAATELAPQPSAPPLPNYSGCFVWLPSGCRAAHPFAAQPQWRQDRWGEANLRSAGSKAACDARKSAFDGWCRVTDAVMAHVPSSAQRVPSQGVVPQGAGVDGTSLQTDVGVSRAAGPARTKSHADHPRRTLPEDAPPLPDGAGCYVWLPSGCKAQHARAARVWMRSTVDVPGGRAADGRAACDARRRGFEQLCQVQDAVVVHVPAEGERPGRAHQLRFG